MTGALIRYRLSGPCSKATVFHAVSRNQSRKIGVTTEGVLFEKLGILWINNLTAVHDNVYTRSAFRLPPLLRSSYVGPPLYLADIQEITR